MEQRDERGRLLGLLPLFGYREPPVGTQKLLLLGTGTTDYLGGVFRHPAAVSLAAQALQFTLTAVPAWSRLAVAPRRREHPGPQIGSRRALRRSPVGGCAAC